MEQNACSVLFSSLEELPAILDSKIAALNSKVISLIPVGAFPRKIARSQLLHFARSEYQFWGWYHFGSKFRGALQNVAKVNTFLNKVPHIEQGIFFF